MENFQRYFLIFSIMIFSYFLIIRWDPPRNESTEINNDTLLNDSEYLQSNEAIVNNESFADALISTPNNCENIDSEKIDTDNWSLTIDLNNGEFLKAELKKFPTEIDSENGKILFNKCGPEKYSQKSGFEFLDRSLKFAENNFYIKENFFSNDKRIIVLEKKENNFIFKKKLSFSNVDYFIDVEDSILNNSSSSLTLAPFSKIDRSEVDLSGSNSIFDPASFAYLGPAFQTSSENYEKVSFNDIEEDSFREVSDKGWISMIEHYFITAIIPVQGDNLIYQAKRNSKLDTYSAGVVGATEALLPGNSRTFNQKVYFGPKVKQELLKTHPDLDLAIDYGWLWWIGQPMYAAMKAFHAITGNWGWSIVLVTILIKLLLWPLSMVSYRNMGKMRAVQPKMQEIQQRYADDRQALSKAMMDLYKKEKVNPALGCLPMLMQMPFFLAFYWVLIETVELKYAPFLFWITDLSTRDPLFILPILNMAAMWGMQQLQPQPVGADPIQANVFKYMPLIFGVMFALFPAGLVLYWFLNSLISAVQMVLHGPKREKASS
ncbi:MAG: membrane protein insertase YidC [Gammaproteobacteria bacterium]